MDVVRALIDAGARVNVRTAANRQSLFRVVSAARRMDVAVALLDAGYDAEVPGADGVTDLEFFSSEAGGDSRVADLILCYRRTEWDSFAVTMR